MFYRSFIIFNHFYSSVFLFYLNTTQSQIFYKASLLFSVFLLSLFILFMSSCSPQSLIFPPFIPSVNHSVTSVRERNKVGSDVRLLAKIKKTCYISAPHPALETEEGHSGQLLVLFPTPQSLHRTSAAKNTKNPNWVRHNDALCLLPNCWHVSHTWVWNPAATICSNRLRQQTIDGV